MKAVIFQAPGRLSLEEVAEPRIEEARDAVVKVTLTAICGSELPAYRGRSERRPGGIGHEFVGTVSALGEGVDRLSVGQRVVSPFSVFCGGCFYCKQGLLTVCERFQAFGRQLPGSQAEYVRVPNADAVLEPLPDALPDEKAIFLAELLTGAFAGLELAGLKAGDSVAVVGCGPTGLAAQLVAWTMGAGQVFAVDHHDYRLAAAASIGSTALDFTRDDVATTVRSATGGRGADIAVEAVGTSRALSDASALVRRRGALLNLGTELDDAASLSVRHLTGDHIRLVPAGSSPVKNYMAPVLKMLLRGVIDPSPLISHTLPLDEAPHGFELMSQRRDNALKVLLRT